MRVILLLPALALATPVVAQSDLPAAPFRSTYIEATCGGGFAGRSETVRVMADGRVVRSSGRPLVVSRGMVAPARYAALSQRLDRADFDHRTSPRTPGRIADGVDCSLTRVQRGVPHTVDLSQAARDLPVSRDMARITDDVMALGRDATTARLRPVAAG